MLTIEEQIERIADHALARASEPVRAPRRWPAMAAAAALLVTAGSVVWLVGGREPDSEAGITSSGSDALASLLDGAVEYPLTSAEPSDDPTSEGLSFREPGTVRAVTAQDGTTVFRESGVTAVPGYGVFEARCAGVDGLTIGCELPNATDLPWILDPTRVGFGMWVDVPAAVDVVVLTDGANRIWQRPVNGLAVWPPTTDSGWTLEAFDANGEPIVRIDQSTIEAQDVSNAPGDPTVGDAEIAGTLSTFRQCLVGEGATFEVEANLPQFAAGIDPSSAWDSCVSSTLDTAAPDAEEAQLPAAYAEVLALFPSNDWIALAVQPGENPSAFAYDRSGRSFGFSYVESMAQQGLPDTTDAPIISLPDGLNLYASYDSAVITTSAGDGALFYCQQTRMPASTAGSSSCLAPDGQPAIGLDQIARTADALLPVLREAPSALAELDNFWPLSVDYETVTRTIQEALGTSTASVSMDPGVLSTLTPGDPLVDDLADGSTMLSMVGPYGVLFRVHVDASVPKETAVAGVRLLDDLVVLGGATPMTSLPQTSGA